MPFPGFARDEGYLLTGPDNGQQLVSLGHWTRMLHWYSTSHLATPSSSSLPPLETPTRRVWHPPTNFDPASQAFSSRRDTSSAQRHPSTLTSGHLRLVSLDIVLLPHYNNLHHHTPARNARSEPPNRNISTWVRHTPPNGSVPPRRLIVLLTLCFPLHLPFPPTRAHRQCTARHHHAYWH